MKRNIIAIGLVFAVLMSFASCKKLPQDNEFVVESQYYVVDDQGVKHELKTEPVTDPADDAFIYIDGDSENNQDSIGGENKVTNKKPDKTKKPGKTEVIYYYEDSNGNKVTVKHEDVVAPADHGSVRRSGNPVGPCDRFRGCYPDQGAAAGNRYLSDDHLQRLHRRGSALYA